MLSFQPYRGGLDWREDSYTARMRYRGPASPAEIPMANGLDIPVLPYGNNLSQYGSALVLTENVQQTATEIALTDSLYATWGGGWQVYGEESGIKYGAMRRSFGNYQYICPMGATEMLYTRTRWDGYMLQAEVDTAPIGGWQLLGALPEQPNIRYYTRQPLVRTVGAKRYELKDHLGNVRMTVSDSRLAWDDGGYHSAADILNHTDYYPYGMGMPGRTYSSGDYRFGFNGQEKESEIHGGENTYSAQFWMYDGRTARRWNTDPEVNYSWSTYGTFDGNPVLYSDPYGNTVTIADNEETKKDIKSLAKVENQEIITYNEQNQVVLNFGDRTEDEIHTILDKDVGIKLLYDLSNATDYNIYYEVGDKSTGYSHSTGKEVERNYQLRKNCISGCPQNYVINWSTTPRNANGGLGGSGYKPPDGYDGYVRISPGTFKTYKTKQDLNRASVVYHELRENYGRTILKMPYVGPIDASYSGKSLPYYPNYGGAHNYSIDMQGNEYGDPTPGGIGGFEHE